MFAQYGIYPGSVMEMGLIHLQPTDPASSQKAAGKRRDEQQPQGWTAKEEMQLGKGRKTRSSEQTVSWESIEVPTPPALHP